MILEYKMDRNSDGCLCVPTWIECGGFVNNPDNFTFIGFSPAIREYKIPDSADILTVQQAKDRALAIHALYPMKNVSGEIMTDAQVNEMVQSIVDSNNIA